ncbi:MAG: hypothetical protein HYV68_01230 [Candidatus Taylorbacteria bacterium]|nr:hypothetical protein [Candidatus Taylorbacteria bacterium]
MNITVFATDTGAAGVLTPVLKALTALGHRVSVFTDRPGTQVLAHPTFITRGITPETPDSYGKGPLFHAMVLSVFERTMPDVVLGGIAAEFSAERLAFAEALRRGVRRDVRAG